MSTLSTRLDAMRDRIQDTLADMSPRDRSLAFGLVIGAVLVIVGGGAWWMRNTLNDLHSRVASREDTLHTIKVMAAEHEVAIGQAEKIKEQLQKFEGTELSAFLEQAAKDTNVSDRLDAVREKSSSSDGVLEEKLYAVALSKLSTEEMASFIFKVETSGYPLKVKSFRAKTQTRKGEVMLNVDMDVSAYRVLATEDEGEEG
jgi:type II secretory pathway component PulM